MENLDNGTIRQVWERVQQKPQSQEAPELASLLTGLRQEAALYALLIKRSNRAGFQPLLKQVNSHIACIKGICILSGANAENFTPAPLRQEPVLAMLRRAYANALGRLTEYEKRTCDAAFGPVFHILAQETKHTLYTLTKLCGGL